MGYGIAHTVESISTQVHLIRKSHSLVKGPRASHVPSTCSSRLPSSVSPMRPAPTPTSRLHSCGALAVDGPGMRPHPKLLVNSNRTQTYQPSSGATVYKISSASLPKARLPLPTAHSHLLDRIYAALICPFCILFCQLSLLAASIKPQLLYRHLGTPPTPPSCLLSTALARAAPPRLLISMASLPRAFSLRTR